MITKYKCENFVFLQIKTKKVMQKRRTWLSISNVNEINSYKNNLHYSVDFIFLFFGTMGFIVEL